MPSKPATGISLKLATALAAVVLNLLAGLSVPSWAGTLWNASTKRTAAIAVPSGAKSATATTDVVEYYHQGLDNYFITADSVEQAAVDAGAAGAFQRTGNAFSPGGPNKVCRFYGNTNINPATGGIYGPNSHFYTADPAECASLKAQFTPNAKSWKFESDDFLITPATNGSCPADLMPVYRAYNNGFARGIDSNHRITSNQAAYLETVGRGWIAEGIVMCAPRPPSGILPPQLAGCSDADCPEGSLLGNGTGLVNVVAEITNTTAAPIELVIPAGQTFIAYPPVYQDGLAVERLQATIPPGLTVRFVIRLFCTEQDRAGSHPGATYAPGPITANAQLLDVIGLASGKLGSTLDPVTLKAGAVQLAIWEITNGTQSLSAAQRNILAALLDTSADDVSTQAMLYSQFEATLSHPA